MGSAIKYILFIFFFGSVVGGMNVYSQEKTNQYDTEGKRHGTWEKFYPETSQLRYRGQFLHGKEIGEFKYYCEDCKDQPAVIKKFNKNDDRAQVKYFTPKGKLVSEGMMKGKERIGTWVYYHKESNQVMARENYSKGQLNGKMVTYYPNGQITEEIDYVMGVKEGANHYYSPQGVLIKKLVYHNGELHGPATYYDAHGNPVIEGRYKNGKKYGQWKYYQDGKLVMEETFPKVNK